MPTLTAVSPVLVDNIGLGNSTSCPLVSFVKKDNIVVTLDASNLTLTYDAAEMLYKGTRGAYRYRTTGPAYTATA